MYQLSIVVGILTAFLSNYLLRNVGEQAWRWMIGIAAFPSLIYGIAVLFIPNSPRWLVMKGRAVEAEKVFKMIDPDTDINSFVAELRSDEAPGNENIFMKKYRPVLLLAFFIAFFNQFSGINAVLYYAPRIFEEQDWAAVRRC
jgi:MFS family permease